MRRRLLGSSLGLATLCLVLPTSGAGSRGQTSFAMDSVDGLQVINTKAEAVKYRGRKSVRLIDLPGQAKESVAGGNTIAVLSGTDFEDGTIEVDVAGAPREGAAANMRGFIGVAFRVQEDRGRFECFYLRPTNGRAEDQLRRNHATQFVAEPEYPWYRLRKESPGEYESYVDLESAAWTHLKIEVAGTKSRLYVNRATQPALVINDMKHAQNRGAIALWIGQDTDGYFSRLTIQQK